MNDQLLLVLFPDNRNKEIKMVFFYCRLGLGHFSKN
jgi:hypothetical protein